MYGRFVGQNKWQSGCRGHVQGQPVLRNQPRNTAFCRASQQAVAHNGSTISGEQPAKFEGNAADVEAANLNACVEFLKEELPRIFKTGVCRHTRTTLQLLHACSCIGDGHSVVAGSPKQDTRCAQRVAHACRRSKATATTLPLNSEIQFLTSMISLDTA